MRLTIEVLGENKRRMDFQQWFPGQKMVSLLEREGEASLVCAAGPLFARQAAIWGSRSFGNDRPPCNCPPCNPPWMRRSCPRLLFNRKGRERFLRASTGIAKPGKGCRVGQTDRAKENLLPGKETVLERIGGQRHGPRTVLERTFVFFRGIDPDFFLRGNGGQVCRKAFIGRAARKRFRRRGSARFDFFRKRSGRERVAEEFAQP